MEDPHLEDGMVGRLLRRASRASAEGLVGILETTFCELYGALDDGYRLTEAIDQLAAPLLTRRSPIRKRLGARWAIDVVYDGFYDGVKLALSEEALFFEQQSARPVGCPW